MISLVVPMISQSGLGALASVLLLAMLIGGFLFAAKAIGVERARQRVTPAQANLVVEEWVNVQSKRRQMRVRSRLSTSEDTDLNPEKYIRISGQSRAALIAPLSLPVLLVALVAALLVGLSFINPDSTPSTQPKADEIPQLGPSFSFGSFDASTVLEVVSWLLAFILLGAVPWAIYTIARWGGTYFALSDYRFYRIWVYPTWMFWINIDPQEVELLMLTSKGFDQNVIGKTFGGFGTLQMDTAGLADDALFNQIPFVPDVEAFSQRIANAQREAIPPAQASESDRQVEGIANAFGMHIDRLIAHLGGDPTTTLQSKETTTLDTSMSDETGEIPPTS